MFSRGRRCHLELNDTSDCYEHENKQVLGSPSVKHDCSDSLVCKFPLYTGGLSMIAQTTGALTMLKPVWNDRSISLSSKIRLMRSLVTSIFLYACESWTITAELQRRIQTMEMRCYIKILCISCKKHVTNEGVRAKIQ